MTDIFKEAHIQSVSPDEAQRLQTAFIGALSQSLENGDSVAIPGFGTFTPSKTDESVIEHPSGKKMLVPPHISLTFSESVVLRKLVKSSIS